MSVQAVEAIEDMYPHHTHNPHHLIFWLFGPLTDLLRLTRCFELQQLYLIIIYFSSHFSSHQRGSLNQFCYKRSTFTMYFLSLWDATLSPSSSASTQPSTTSFQRQARSLKVEIQHHKAEDPLHGASVTSSPIATGPECSFKVAISVTPWNKICKWS